MIRQGHVFCDFCSEHMGQLWNLPAAAPDLLAPPDFRVCDDCVRASEPATSSDYFDYELTHDDVCLR